MPAWSIHPVLLMMINGEDREVGIVGGQERFWDDVVSRDKIARENIKNHKCTSIHLKGHHLLARTHRQVRVVNNITTIAQINDRGVVDACLVDATCSVDDDKR